VLVSVGVRLSRRQNTTDEYFLAKLEGRVFSRGNWYTLNRGSPPGREPGLSVSPRDWEPSCIPLS
jgi:hypothetical protein